MSGADLDQAAVLRAPGHFEPAQNPVEGSQFLQIVAKPKRAAPRAKPEPKLTRVAFRVSRLMEFCSERELVSQTGHPVWQWPLVVAKELVDNALDACEEAEVAPAISVIVEPDTIIVQDNADGIDAGTIESVLDYTIRVSSREAYVSPTRGAQGNALKTILAMGYVLGRRASGGEAAGITIIESRGVAHRIEFLVDHINNQPKIAHTKTVSTINVGTRITVKWPPSELFDQWGATRFKELVGAYTWFNPHLSLRGTWLGQEFVSVEATNPNWEKWRPTNPTSALWYDVPRLQRYMQAHVSWDRDRGQRRTVREFIAEFRGLSSTAVQRKILCEVGCSHQSLADFFGVEKVNSAGVASLLAAMKNRSKPVAPQHLGVIGAAHFKQRFLAAGGNADTFKYQCRKGMAEGIPYVVEFAFGLHQAALAPDGGAPRVVRSAENRISVASQDRVFVTGANWSSAIGNPFRNFGSTGEGLDTTLAKVRANANQPVICALHLASARLQYADRGKSSIILADDAEQPDD